MCGIAGIVNYQNIDLNAITRTLQHRGPDEQIVYTDQNLALIHTRLAIQDISNGKQPFHHDEYSIIFNGEIYNHLKLRELLKEFNFQTKSDTETFLYLFIKFNIKMFDFIDGMFACCIYDKKKQKLFFARDRSGKKPLYYMKTSDQFIFASEINVFKLFKELIISDDAIHCYLRTGLIWKHHTIYKNILELEAGSYLFLDMDTLKETSGSYFDILSYYEMKNPLKISFKEAINLTHEKLLLSISDRILASDTEVGVFLSGGIDSNLIAALATSIHPGIKTFTVRFDGLYDESQLAKLTAKQYQTQHIELTVSTKLEEDIEKILSQYGEPFMDSSAIPTYYVSKEAAKHVKVVLGGDGADELFAGYRRYLPIRYNLGYFFAKFHGLLKLLPPPKEHHSLYNYLYRLLSLSTKKDLDFYLSATTDIFENVIGFPSDAITYNLNQFIQKISVNQKLTPLQRMLYLDFSIILFSDLLVKVDIASMANSLEVRSPFLSKYLLELIPNLPDSYKVRGFKTKYLLRELAKNHLPKQIVKQPKRGFEVPLVKWINVDLKKPIRDRLTVGCFSENFVKRSFISQLINEKLNISSQKRAKILWALYCLEVWYVSSSQNNLQV